jgi:vacuolar-type H+-ATPase subunit H
MVKDVIDGIKATEAEAARVIEEARRKKAEDVAGAKEEARAMVENARKQGADEVRQALERAGEEAARRTAEIAEAEEQERQKLRRSSSGNIPKAVEAVIKRMLD